MKQKQKHTPMNGCRITNSHAFYFINILFFKQLAM